MVVFYYNKENLKLFYFFILFFEIYAYINT